jgi:hypothetical protein
MKRMLVLALGLVAACGSRAPQLVPPERVESFCSEKEPRGTAIASILSSVADQKLNVSYPGDAVLRQSIKQHGGVIGHWKSQPLYLPGMAAALGVSGNYVDVTDVYIDNQLEAADSRLIYVAINVAGATQNMILRAYDTQNVCVEGRRLS